MDGKRGQAALLTHWAQLIKQVYQVDPVVCQQGGVALRVFAFLEEPELTGNMVTCLGGEPKMLRGYEEPMEQRRQ